MLLALIVMATLTLGLLFSGWLTPTPGRAQQGAAEPQPSHENTNCVQASLASSCVSGGSVSLIAPTNSPVTCLGSLVSVSAGLTNVDAQVQWTATYSNCPSDTWTDSVTPSYGVTWTVSGVGANPSGGIGTTAIFTPTNCGSGTVNFSLSYTNQTPCGGTGGSSTSGSFTVLSLNIVDGSGRAISAANSNNVVIVGQNIGLSAQTCGGTFSNFQWTVAGTTESNFYVSSDPLWTNGYPVALTDTTNSSVSFFWVDAGSKSVSCSAVCGGVTCSTNVTFTVVRPTEIMVVSNNGPIAIDNTYYNNGILALHYGTRGSSIPGIRGILFSNTVLMPPTNYYYNNGNTNYDTEWVQIIINSPLIRFQTNDATGDWYDLGAANVLDSYYNYNNGALNVNPNGDAPGVGLDNTKWKAVITSEQFTMWLMFRPAGGQWVPLHAVTWSWGGTATWSGTGWNLTNPSKLVTSDADSTIYPPMV